MKTNTSKLTFSAVVAAAVIALIYITTLIDTMQLAAAVISTFAVMLTLKICGRKVAAMHCTVVSVLLFMILPNKFFAVLYAVFFGFYAIAKSLIEQKNNLKVEWFLKIAYFLAASALIFTVFKFFAAESIVITNHLYMALYFLAVLIMAVYDIFLSFFSSQLFIITDKYLKNIKK